MIRAYVDANVILRFLLGDPPEMAEQSARLFHAVENRAVTLIVDDMVVAEVVWVLGSYDRLEGVLRVSPGAVTDLTGS